MREITRIHIAKVAYDIELDAKKDIENYIKALERYANDQEILDDIEIRITELLTEQGVAAGGVVAKADVAAVRARLGEPSDFASEDAKGSDWSEETESEPRRVYRDENDAILGGVLAGLGKFFGVDPLWARLLFIIVLFASGGTALVVYLILWLIIPPAQTAAEKLQMGGHPVTLASIKALGEKVEPMTSKSAPMLRRILRIATGIVLIIGAVAALGAVVAVIVNLLFLGYGDRLRSVQITEPWWIVPGFSLLTVAGILLSALCMILAIATLRRHWSRRIATAVVVIIVAGILTFVGGVGTLWYGYDTRDSQLSELRQSSKVQLPENFNSISAISTSTDDEVQGDIRYFVSDNHYYTLDTYPGIRADITVSDDGETAVIKLTGEMSALLAPTLTIYGPAVEKINLDDDSSVVFYSNESEQSKLSINALSSGTIFHLDGIYASVEVNSDAYSKLRLDNAAISELSINGGGVWAGIVRALNVTQPDVCPAHNGYMGTYTVAVTGVSSGRLTYNGVEQPDESTSNGCGKIIIGPESHADAGW